SAYARSLRVHSVAQGLVGTEAKVATVGRLTVFLLVLSIVWLGFQSPLMYAFSLSVGALLSIGLSIRAVAGCRWRGAYDRRRATHLLQAAMPIGLNALAVWTYYRSSVLILSHVAGSAEVGLLGAA